MPAPLLSIVIPTHRRPEILKTCLEYLEKQTIANQLEVIVVHDGEDDAETKAMIQDMKMPFPLHYFSIPKSQQGVARNYGINKATAPITLFIGDDIFLAPNACEKHCKVHEQFRGAVLGFTTWDPSLEITPVMRWLEATGWQFGYPLLKSYHHKIIPPAHQHRFTYTSHISLQTETAKKIPFREDITLYGWEDIEWGQRLRDAGVKLFYEPEGIEASLAACKGRA